MDIRNKKVIFIRLSWHLGMYIVLLGFIGLSGFICGQDVDLLVSPGKLSRVHSEFAGIKNCSACHTEKKKADPAKCLACHKDLAERINKGKGFHKDKKSDCITCHPEHQGESFKLIEWDPKSFDHAETGYSHTGLHKKIKDCNTCHNRVNEVPGKKSKTYLLKGSACVNCHADFHKGQLGSVCDKCHNTDTPFKHTAINHENTKFPLRGAHVTVTCAKCHKDNRWNGFNFSSCSNCHPNPHNPPFKQKCTECHNETSWKSVSTSSFNHDSTRFPLKGKHRQLTCAKCHLPSAKTRQMPFANCTDCHKKDPHQGQFNTDCKSCHVVDGFDIVRVNHNATRFPLSGKHEKLTCKKCHTAREGSKQVIYKPLPIDCSSCHADYHLGQLGKRCDACHTVNGFKRNIPGFDHQAVSSFQLKGKHTTVACAKCHVLKKQQFPGGMGETVLFKPLVTVCSSCHTDPHAGQFDNNCSNCHQPDGFKPVKGFDHEKTKFSLKGFHEKVECVKCHKPEQMTVNEKQVTAIRYKSLGKTCMECHKDYDHSKTAFPLTGKHKKIDCRACHNERTPNTTAYRKTPGNLVGCIICHRSPHPGNQEKCTDCHNTETWRVEAW